MKKQQKFNDRITLRKDNFAQWYTNVAYNAGLFDYGEVKGSIIFKSYGLAIWQNIQNYLQQKFNELDIENVYFPMLIPKSLFEKEQQHIKGFNPELATVTKIGQTPLHEDLFIRPTSEILMNLQFAKEVKSYRDLPIKYNQWCNVIRWEKNTRPFLRTNEFLWQEGHTVHESNKEANDFALKILDVYSEMANNLLAIPVIKGLKTEKEKFAGAIKSYTIESLMYDGQSLQCGTSHYFGQNFTKLFKVMYEGVDQKLSYAASSSWGVSTRLIGAIIMTHGDDRGLVLPFNVAPIQIQIIKFNMKNNELNNYAQLIKKQIKNNYRIKINKSYKSFGYQIKQAEVQGIPIRIEIGFKDLNNNQITIAVRNQKEKIICQLKDINETLDKILNHYDKNLFNNAKENLNQAIVNLKTFEEYEKLIKTRNILALVPFCCSIECENKIKELTQSNSRCIPFDHQDLSTKNIKCFKCERQAKLLVYIGKAY